jgi:curved DNA-binding protein CbpA
MIETHYEVLGVAQTATTDEIKNAYRQQAFRWHPDKNQGSKESEERFKRIAGAYAVLADPTARAQYDQLIREGSGAADRFKPDVDAASAAEMFLREMVELAFELTFLNVPCSKIADALVERGCPQLIASEIARGVEAHRKVAVRKAAGGSLAWAAGLIILGAIITAASYSAAEPGGQYLVTTGLFVVGGYKLLKALFHLLSGEVP